VSAGRMAPEATARTLLVEQAVALRVAGLTFDAIADRLGVVTSTAWKLVDTGVRWTKKDIGEDITRLRALEAQRLDELWRVAFVQAIGNKAAGIPASLRAMDRCLRISERRSRLLGLDVQAEPAGAAGEGGKGDTFIDILVIHGADQEAGGAIDVEGKVLQGDDGLVHAPGVADGGEQREGDLPGMAGAGGGAEPLEGERRPG